MSNELLSLAMFVMGVKHAYKGLKPMEFKVRSLDYDWGYSCVVGSVL